MNIVLVEVALEAITVMWREVEATLEGPAELLRTCIRNKRSPRQSDGKPGYCDTDSTDTDTTIRLETEHDIAK